MENRILWFVVGSALVHASVIALWPNQPEVFKLQRQGSPLLAIQLTGPVVMTKANGEEKPSEAPRRESTLVENTAPVEEAVKRVVKSTAKPDSDTKPQADAALTPTKPAQKHTQSTGKVESIKVTKKADPIKPVAIPQPDARPVKPALQRIEPTIARTEEQALEIAKASATQVESGNLETPPQQENGANVAAGNTPTNKADDEQLARVLRHEFSRYFYYPSAARRRNWQGKVVLGFVVMPDGQIEEIHIDQSSGYTLLDNAAVQALRKVKPLALNGTKVSQILPVEYRLTDSY